MSDISTLWDTARGDWSLAGADLASGNDLITAVLISLFSDRVAQTDDVIPDGSKDLRGWWGDTAPVPIGSRLWLIERAKKTQATLGAAQGYIEEALQWMISDGICSRIDVYCEWTRQQTLGARITAYPIGSLAPVKVQTQNVFKFSQVQVWGWNEDAGTGEWESRTLNFTVTCILDPYWGPQSTEDLYWYSDTRGNSYGSPLSTDLKTVTTFIAGAALLGSEAKRAGKWYCEMLMGGSGYTAVQLGPAVGLGVEDMNLVGNSISLALVLGNDGTIYFSGASVGITGIAAIAAGQVIMIAWDATTGSIWLGRNGTWFNSGNPAAGTGAVKTGIPGVSMAPLISTNVTSNVQATLRGKATEFSFAAPTGFSAWGGATNGTALTLHGNGPNGSTAIADSSRFARSVLANGAAAISTAQSKFGGASLGLPGASAADWYSTPQDTQFAFRNRPGCVECWVYPSNFSINGKTIFSTFQAGNGGFYLQLNQTTGALLFHGLVAGGGEVFSGGTGGFTIGTLPAGSWSHVLIDKVDNTWFFYLNGVLVGMETVDTVNSGQSSAAGLAYVGSLDGAQATVLQGFVDELRFTKGAARHAVFTGAPWPNSVAAGDPSYALVTLLVHAEGSFADSSSYGQTPALSSAVISSAQSKYGTSAMKFNGSGSYVSFGRKAEYNPGSGDFTVEMWFWDDCLNTIARPLCGYCFDTTAAGNAFQITATSSNSITAVVSNGTTRVTIQTAGIPKGNAWNHVALVRSGTGLRFYLNGKQGPSVTLSGALAIHASADFRIGSFLGDGGFTFSGYVDDFRYTVGLARYTASFHPEYRGASFTLDALPFCDQ